MVLSGGLNPTILSRFVVIVPRSQQVRFKELGRFSKQIPSRGCAEKSGAPGINAPTFVPCYLSPVACHFPLPAARHPMNASLFGICYGQ